MLTSSQLRAGLTSEYYFGWYQSRKIGGKGFTSDKAPHKALMPKAFTPAQPPLIPLHTPPSSPCGIFFPARPLFPVTYSPKGTKAMVTAATISEIAHLPTCIVHNCKGDRKEVPWTLGIYYLSQYDFLPDRTRGEALTNCIALNDTKSTPLRNPVVPLYDHGIITMASTSVKDASWPLR